MPTTGSVSVEQPLVKLSDSIEVGLTYPAESSEDGPCCSGWDDIGDADPGSHPCQNPSLCLLPLSSWPPTLSIPSGFQPLPSLPATFSPPSSSNLPNSASSWLGHGTSFQKSFLIPKVRPPLCFHVPRIPLYFFYFKSLVYPCPSLSEKLHGGRKHVLVVHSRGGNSISVCWMNEQMTFFSS